MSRARRTIEVAVVALCLWTALYQTPMGALLRWVGATMVGRRAEQRSLLSYYNGGVSLSAPTTRLPLPPPLGASPSQALALGVVAAYRRAPEAVQQQARAALHDRGVPQAVWLDDRAAALAIEQALGSDSTRLVEIFVGADGARFAERRASAEARGFDFDDLARQLPPAYSDGINAAASAAALSVAYGLLWPTPRALISSPFGWRTHPVTGDRKFHKGVDLQVPTGTTVRATGDGVVKRSSYDASNGNLVVIDHGYGVHTLYLHNSERLVQPKTRVQQSTPVAKSGATGIATGPHLHYQLEIAGEPIDPTVFTTAH